MNAWRCKRCGRSPRWLMDSPSGDGLVCYDCFCDIKEETAPKKLGMLPAEGKEVS